eukprot:4343725-Amphidinium_carterae.3
MSNSLLFGTVGQCRRGSHRGVLHGACWTTCTAGAGRRVATHPARLSESSRCIMRGFTGHQVHTRNLARVIFIP